MHLLRNLCRLCIISLYLGSDSSQTAEDWMYGLMSFISSPNLLYSYEFHYIDLLFIKVEGGEEKRRGKVPHNLQLNLLKNIIY